MKGIIGSLFFFVFCVVSTNNSLAATNDDSILFYMNAILSVSNQTTNSSVSGYWNAYHQEYGHSEEGPDQLNLSDVDGIITGQFRCGESGIDGMHTENTVWLEFYTNSNSEYTYAEGKLGNNIISGTYSFERNGTAVGIWWATKSSTDNCP